MKEKKVDTRCGQCESCGVTLRSFDIQWSSHSRWRVLIIIPRCRATRANIFSRVSRRRDESHEKVIIAAVISLCVINRRARFISLVSYFSRYFFHLCNSAVLSFFSRTCEPRGECIRVRSILSVTIAPCDYISTARASSLSFSYCTRTVLRKILLRHRLPIGFCAETMTSTILHTIFVPYSSNLFATAFFLNPIILINNNLDFFFHHSSYADKGNWNIRRVSPSGFASADSDRDFSTLTYHRTLSRDAEREREIWSLIAKVLSCIFMNIYSQLANVIHGWEQNNVSSLRFLVSTANFLFFFSPCSLYRVAFVDLSVVMSLTRTKSVTRFCDNHSNLRKKLLGTEATSAQVPEHLVNGGNESRGTFQNR